MLVTPSRAAGAREELDRVEQALQELPDNQREAVLLSRIGGISYGDIARQMTLSESAVRGTRRPRAGPPRRDPRARVTAALHFWADVWRAEATFRERCARSARHRVHPGVRA